jgi:hypothetical protein
VASAHGRSTRSLGDRRTSVILSDFQISPALSQSIENRALSLYAFPLYEAVRLALRQRRQQAPFRKIVLTLRDAKTYPDTLVGVALSICEALVPVDAEHLLIASTRWETLVDAATRGLKVVHNQTGYDTRDLLSCIERSGRSDPPCAFQFDKLARFDRASDIRAETWFLARPGHSAISVRLVASQGSQEVAVCTRDGPLWIEDDFPVRSARMRGGHYELLDARRKVIASVPIPHAPLRSPNPSLERP